MSEADDDVTVATSVSSPQALTITVGGASYTVEPSDGPITIGRGFPAQIQVEDPRISRTHARLEVRGGHWLATDHSSNGVFLNGTRQPSVILTDGMTLHLGNPEGIVATVALSPVTGRAETIVAAGVSDEPPDGDRDDEAGEYPEDSDVTDRGIMRAGAAVAARRRELDISQRLLAKEKVINAGALIAFEKGRSWPRRSTLARLEQVLNWAPGTIARLRSGEQDDGQGEYTEVLTNTVQAPLMAQALDVALDTIGTQIDSLATLPDTEFTHRAGLILADLRKLEQIAATAARAATGAPDVAMSLSAVRRIYRDLMLRAAQAPQATFGQRLFAARHRAELSSQEAANAAGVSVGAMNAAEADGPLSPDVSAAVTTLFGALSKR